MVHTCLVFILTFLISLYMSISTAAQNTHSVLPSDGDNPKNQSSANLIDRAERQLDRKQDKLNDKQKRFEALRQRYKEEESSSESQIYRRTKDSKNRPANRYEEFEQKRARHRSYNEYIEQVNEEATNGRLRSGAIKNYSE